MTLDWRTDAFSLEFRTDDDGPVALAAVRLADGTDARISAPSPLVQILTADGGHSLAVDRLAKTVLGASLRYVEHRAAPRRLEIVQHGGGLEVVTVLETTGAAALSVRSVLRSTAADELLLTAVTTWSSGLGSTDGHDDDLDDWRVLDGRSDWLAEGRWTWTSLRGGPVPSIRQELTGHDPRSALVRVSTGSWSTGGAQPLGAAESRSRGLAWLWEIEHNGAWRWDLGETDGAPALSLAGPTDRDHQWLRALAPGEEFETVPATVALGRDFDAAVAAVTAHRRARRTAHPDNDSPAVAFNDYMNTLNGDPTTEKLLPLVDAAAAVGAEIFCIDAGWYDDSGDWWDGVGEWLPSTVRFSGGLQEVTDRIVERGMVPGLWLEPEVVGAQSPMAESLPDEAFLQRRGRRVREHDRFHLDLRHPAARAHLDGVVDRLVADFGAGFFKLDYNIDAGPGTDLAADSVGHGLLQHNRAHLAWLDGVTARHPDLVIENCGSGAMRQDQAMLRRTQVQSTSDQQDPLLYPPIAAAAPLGMLPEQAASWGYPQPGMTEEEVAFCLVTSLLGRFYLSGYLNRMEDAGLELVRESVRVAKDLRADLVRTEPSWPLGLPGWDDDVVALALHAPDRTYVSVWDRGGSGEPIDLPLPRLAGASGAADTLFPVALASWRPDWDAARGVLTVRPAPGAPAARTFVVDHGSGRG